MTTRNGLAVVAALTLTALAACGGDVTYRPYEGPTPYPDRRPKIPLPAGPIALVSNSGSDDITLIDIDGHSVIASVPVGRDPVDIDGPHHLAADRAQNVVYVALSYPALGDGTGPHAKHGSSTRAGYVQKLALDDLRVLGEVRIDPNPGEIVLSADRKRIVVTHFDLKRATDPKKTPAERKSTLMVIDPAQILATGSAPPRRIDVCLAPHGTVLSRPDGQFAFVACYGDDAIAVVNLVDPAAPVVMVPVGPGAGGGGTPIYGPYSVVMSPDGTRLAIGNTESKDVRFFDVATLTMTGDVVDAGGAPYFVAWSADGKSLFVPTQGPDSIRVVDLSTQMTTTVRPLEATECQRPHEIALGGANGLAYVVCEGDHKTRSRVVGLDVGSLATMRAFDVGIYPDRFFVMERP